MKTSLCVPRHDTTETEATTPNTRAQDPVYSATSGIICLSADVLILGGCLWAYRRFHLRSVPWIAAYLIFQQLWPILASLLRKQLVLQPPFQGNDPYWLRLTVNDFAILYTYASSAFASAAKLLIAWFIISEVSYECLQTQNRS